MGINGNTYLNYILTNANQNWGYGGTVATSVLETGA